MSQAYSDPKRESDPYALPDVEVWHSDDYPTENGKLVETGWYYWPCFPGCIPDGDPIGPFETEEEALADAREGVED